MLSILSDVLAIATRTNHQPTHRARQRPNPAHEENRRKAWSLISGLRF